jgi:glycosyltransferase involved in cell wall biosynthesis
MRIGIDVRPLSRPPAGIYRAMRNVLQRLQELDAENTYYLYSDREFELPLRNSRWQKRVDRRFSFLPGSVWLQTDAKRMAVEDDVDVFWGTAHALPLGLPPSVRKILTLHDLIWVVCPDTMSLYNRLVHSALAGRSIRQADVICVPSESTRQGLINYLGGKGKEIEVAGWGIEDYYFPRDPTAAAKHIAQKFCTSPDYLCTVGTLAPRKNLGTLIEAVRILHDRHQCKAQLLIAGGKGWKNSPLYKQLAKSGLTEKEVTFLGYLPEEDMPYLYAGASVFVFPSFYEGFGFPVLEAMACGAPVVASNVSSIPEVAGGAAVLFDPHLPGELAEAILRVRSSPRLREQLIRSGVSRAAQFKWADTARAMLAVLTGSELRTIQQVERLKHTGNTSNGYERS